MNSQKNFEIKNNILYKFDDEGARSVVVPDGVTDINNSAFNSCEKLTIKCPTGSLAEEFAKKNNINYKLID